MKGVLDACVDAAEKAGETKITHIKLIIGELTQIQPDALEFAFEALSPETIASSATLELDLRKPISLCNECGNRYEHDRFQMLCPKCGSFNLEQVQGREFLVDSIETE